MIVSDLIHELQQIEDKTRIEVWVFDEHTGTEREVLYAHPDYVMDTNQDPEPTLRMYIAI